MQGVNNKESAFTASPAVGPKGERGMSKEQGAGFYRFKIGEFEVASVSDGFLQVENPKTMIAAGASEREFQAFMESKFLPSTTAYFQINSLYVDTEKHKVLIDNGMGPYLGPSGGHLPDHLRNLGVAPEEIDIIIISHAHLDHVFGTLAPNGSQVFPNAAHSPFGSVSFTLDLDLADGRKSLGTCGCVHASMHSRWAIQLNARQ